MATNFPGSQDSFTNPTSSDTLDSPDHAAQHANVNDAVEAIELALLDGAPMYIDDTNERVGIGTASPSYELDVTGTVNASSRVRIGGEAGLYLNGTTIEVGSASSGKSLSLAAGGSNRLFIDSSGKVGIGTTNPATDVHIFSGNSGVTSQTTLLV